MQYSIIYTRQPLAESEKRRIVSILVRKIGTSEDKVHRLLDSPRAIIKSQLSCNNALKYQIFLQKIGVSSVIESDHS